MQNQVVSREDWLKARLELLSAEKEVTHQRDTLTRGAAGWLCLAAAPTFAIMALLTSFLVAARWMRSARPRIMHHR